MENVESLVLEQLRHIRMKLDQISEDINDLKARSSNVDSSIIAVRRDSLNAEIADAHLQVSLDRLAKRIERVEARLDLV